MEEIFSLFIKLHSAFITRLIEPLGHFIGRAYLRAKGVQTGKGVCIYGLPIISIYKGSRISVGDSVILRSASRGNAIGVNHEVIIRTMWSNALVEIGDRVGMSGGSICAIEKVIIGNDVLIGANVVIADNDFHEINRKDASEKTKLPSKPVIIEDNVWIGADVYICKGVVIGRNSIIGAKSVVTKSIPPDCIVAGVPASHVKNINK